MLVSLDPALVSSVCDASIEALGVCAGPDHALVHANVALQTLLGERLTPGKFFRDASPALVNGPLHVALDRVFGSGLAERVELPAGQAVWVTPWPRSGEEAAGVVLALAQTQDDTGLADFGSGWLAPHTLDGHEARPTDAAAGLSPVDLRLLGAISHELRTAIHVLMGYGQLLTHELGPELEPRAGGYLLRVLATTDLLGQRVNDLIDLERIGQGDFRIEPKPVPFGTLLAQAIERVQALAERKGVRFEADVPAALPVVMADERRLGSALFKVLDNAIKFTPPGGVVTLRARAEGDTVACQIQDTGVGIPTARLARLFRPFDADQAGQPPGSVGLGLALGKAYIEAHGGALSVHSQVGKGTLCSIAVPLPGAARPSARLA